MNKPDRVNAARRALFVKGGAAVGAGLLSSVGAATALIDDSPRHGAMALLHSRIAGLEGREALRALQSAFTDLLEARAYDALPALFTDDATVDLYGESFSGKQPGLRQLFGELYASKKAPVLQTAFRREGALPEDRVVTDAEGRKASGLFHLRVRMGRPFTGHSALAAMAGQQGMDAAAEWENGRYEMEGVREGGRWLIRRLKYQRV